MIKKEFPTWIVTWETIPLKFFLSEVFLSELDELQQNYWIKL